MSNTIFYNIFFSSILSFLFYKLYIHYFSGRIKAIPNNRSSHSDDKTSGAGLSFSLAFLLIAIINQEYIYLLGLPILVLGLFDDIFSLPSTFRFLIQLIFAISLVNIFYSKIISISNSEIDLGLKIIFTILITAIINFINFMDGLDGLVASCSTIFFLIVGIIHHDILIALASSILVFLRFNWNPAKSFMGDAGSLFIGSQISICLMKVSNIIEFIILLSILLPLLLDPTLCLIRRIYYKQNIFKAHRLHTYQRLNQSGVSHGNIALIYATQCILIALSYISFSYAGLIASICLFIFSFAYLDLFVAKRFNVIIQSR